jgi:outer membrane scaffolding protein for murein synthesis (MipA/OmpV family)
MATGRRDYGARREKELWIMPVKNCCLLGATLLIMAGPTAAAERSWQVGLTSVVMPADRHMPAEYNVHEFSVHKFVPGVGVWAAHSPSAPVFLEVEVGALFPQRAFFPQSALSRLLRRELLAVAGARVGRSFGPLSLFARLRPGLLQSKHEVSTLQPVYPPMTYGEADFVVDAGATLMYRLSERWMARLDAGDLFIPSDQRHSRPFEQHNLRVTLGLGIAF